MKRKDGWFDVSSNDNRHWLETSYWRSSQDKAMYDIGFFVKEETAIAALNHPDTPQPPGWKAEKPASPGLRAAEAVWDELSFVTRNDEAISILRADRVAVLEEMRRRFFSKGLGYAGEVIDSFIEELRGQQ